MTSVAATGDLRNNLEKLRSELRNTCVKEEEIELEAIARGEPIGFLPLLHKVLLDNSLLIARFLSEQGYQLYHISDRPFLEGVFRVVRNEFSYKPSLTLDQFLSSGFAERKIIFVCDVIKLCRRKAEELARLQKASGKTRPLQDPSLESTPTIPEKPSPTGMFQMNVQETPSSSVENHRFETSTEARRHRGLGQSARIASTAQQRQHIRSSNLNGNAKTHKFGVAQSSSGHAQPSHDTTGNGEVLSKQNGTLAAASSYNDTMVNSASGVGRTHQTAPFHHQMAQMHQQSYVPHASHLGQAAKDATSGGSWRSKRSLTLQTGSEASSSSSSSSSSVSSSVQPYLTNGNGAHENGAHQQGLEDLKSPSSSGPVSPVSITSAASAPAVFRQVPIRAKPDMIGNLHHQQQSWASAQVPLTNASSFSSSVVPTTAQDASDTGSENGGPAPSPSNPPFINVHNTSRAMECWVTSPPQLIDRAKRKESMAAHLNKPHTSPRIHGSRGSSPSSMHRTNSMGSLPGTSKRNVTGSVAAAAGLMSRPKSGQNSPVSASKGAAFATRSRSSSSQGPPSPHQMGNAAAVMAAAASWNQKPFSPAKERPTGNIARKLKLPSGGTSSASSQPTNGPIDSGAAGIDASTPSAPLQASDSRISSSCVGDHETASTSLSHQKVSPEKMQASSVNTTTSVPDPGLMSASRTASYSLGTVSSTTPSAHQSTNNTDLSLLMMQMNKIAMAFESVAQIPERFDAMEKRVNSALQSMNQRISDIDMRIRQQSEDLSSNGASTSSASSSQPVRVNTTGPVSTRVRAQDSQRSSTSQNENGHEIFEYDGLLTISSASAMRGVGRSSTNNNSIRASSTSLPSSASNRSNHLNRGLLNSSRSRENRGGENQHATNNASSTSNAMLMQRSHMTSVPPVGVSSSHDSEGIDDFIKVIEERFRETETVLAESEN
mmetsp:Transcript_4284/g.9266  ORF Transcript_4284/g.9266 Transcript_4284/m.9266 type:complete len:945 (+) Transcript_4284:602-3436(+)|eukprot:CAMPEP_0171491068 /NCGR_PEP_ID=MMETSP0958-20121227/3658_1 /TAXON_ID=87120 /ORGANISM="Aurantiochytrium limacinum, Strain ATCCMYA-1381" /LENGTH=944 /DNA_ID=CAMNT_0012024453 /DNA_START=470 /DNA_END=3304 /DNA_ORIENTATION=-